MSMPASSWSRSARSTASSSISWRSAGPNSPRSAASMPATNHDGRACEPTTLVRSPSVMRKRRSCAGPSDGRCEGEDPCRVLDAQLTLEIDTETALVQLPRGAVEQHVSPGLPPYTAYDP